MGVFGIEIGIIGYGKDIVVLGIFISVNFFLFFIVFIREVVEIKEEFILVEFVQRLVIDDGVFGYIDIKVEFYFIVEIIGIIFKVINYEGEYLSFVYLV